MRRVVEKEMIPGRLKRREDRSIQHSSGPGRVHATVIFIITVKHQNMDFVKSFPTNFTAKTVISVKTKTLSFLHNVPLLIHHLLPEVQHLAGDLPEKAPLVPGLGVP